MSVEQKSERHVEPYRYNVATKVGKVKISTNGGLPLDVDGSNLSQSTRDELMNIYNTMRKDHYAKYVEATDRLKSHYKVSWIKWRCPYDAWSERAPFPEIGQMRDDDKVTWQDDMRPWHIMHYGTCSSCFSAGEMFTECPCRMHPDVNACSQVRSNWRRTVGPVRKFLPIRTHGRKGHDIYNPLFLAALFNGRVYFSTKHPQPDYDLDTDWLSAVPDDAIWNGIITADEWHMINEDS